MERYGKTLDRTRYEPNGINICGEYTEVILYDFNSNEVSRTLIDTEDVDRVLSKKWYLNKDTGYVQSNVGDSMSLHRFIMGSPIGLQIDHRDHNKLNNRKGNLRLATVSQNGMNKGLQSNNTSGHTGVRKSHQKWEAYIKIQGNTIHLGRFDNIKDAIAARKVAEKKYFGEYAYQEVN